MKSLETKLKEIDKGTRSLLRVAGARERRLTRSRGLSLTASEQVPRGTAYTARKKAEVFHALGLPELLADKIWAASKGKNIIISRRSTLEERQRLSPSDPSGAPTHVFEPSPFFNRALE